VGVGGGGGSSLLGTERCWVGGNGRAWRRASLSLSLQGDFGESKYMSMEILVVLVVTTAMLAAAPEHRCGRSQAGSAAA